MRYLVPFLMALSFSFLVHEHSMARDLFDPARLEKQVIVAACDDPMQLELCSDGRILFIQRNGAVKLVRPQSREVVTLGQVPVATFGEVGMMGLACDRDFISNGHLYLFFCPQNEQATMRVSRFTVRDEKLDLASEIKLFDYPIDVDGAIHMGGGMWMDGKGRLLIGTGDNCPPIPELPVDRRPGHKISDAMRTAANSRDLRGKILRIQPQPDGSYSVPKDNLFPDGKDGRPEIYAMGCRNPFRVTVDDQTDAVYWGDVGPNIQVDLGIGPNGYDEVNRATAAGNFGWPMFNGPNEAFRLFDFETRKPGPLFDVKKPVNDSPNNTGIQNLPLPQPAFLWYPSGESDRWPSVGSGGRSAMAGPVYHAPQTADATLRLHDSFDGQVFLYEWTRNWLRTGTVNADGTLGELTPFMPNSVFRKPIDMEFAGDGTLYVIEYGDKWGDNHDAQIVRVVYRRGNREPHPVLKADVTAGRQPLTVQFDGGLSSDLDQDKLTWEWAIQGAASDAHGSTLTHTFDQPGRYIVTMKVTDAAGASRSTSTEIRVGNAAPKVELLSPAHGSFVDWGQTVRYRIAASDFEDGTTDDGKIASGRVLLNRQFEARRTSTNADAGDDGGIHPGLALMRKTTCFSCHTTKSQSAGPAYREVGRKYVSDAGARERLANKVITGGTGVWGPKPMPPHPQHTIEQTRLMVDWILTLAADGTAEPVPGVHGFFRADAPGPLTGLSTTDSGVFVLTAEYTDNGVSTLPGVSSLRSEATCVLHSRRKRAAFFDRRSGGELVDVFERGAGLVMRMAPGDWLAFDDLRLTDVDRISWSIAALSGAEGFFSLRLDSPTGKELARVKLTGKTDIQGEFYEQLTTPLKAPDDSLHSLYVVALDGNGRVPTDVRSAIRPLTLAWLEFGEAPAAKEKRLQEDAKVKRVVLIPTKLDHPWATHMYSDVCKILATCLNEHPDVEAVVSPDLDWPRDARLLQDADAIVYYSRPAGDIVLSPEHREEFEALMKKGVGFSAVHWATGAEQNVGPRYEEILGGWFNFAFSGIKVDQQPLIQKVPDHPICRGWNSWNLRDEFYLNQKLSPKATPILSVTVDGHEQTVAWINERVGGGRSFGTTLGHFHDNYEIPEFRRLIVNGILWSAGIEVPESGAVVDIDSKLLELPEPPRTLVKEWTLADLQHLAEMPQRGRSFAKGEQLFRLAGCAGCHRIGTAGGVVGPDLTEVRVRMAKQDHPSLALLREIVEPSHVVEEKYRTQILQLTSGQVITGIVLEEKDGILRVAANPAKPEEIMQIAVSDIEDRTTSKVSMMPIGLLNTLQEDEIRDLLAYVEAGGRPEYFLFVPPVVKREAWVRADMPVPQHLEWWLDAATLNEGRRAIGLPDVASGQNVDLWPDGSGHRRHVAQRQQSSQPILLKDDQGTRLKFDGDNDLLTSTTSHLRMSEFTAVMRVRPEDNRSWPGIVSGNAFNRNDYQSGFNIDLMNVPTDTFSSLMTEGPGYAGVVNIMNDQIPFGQWTIVTVTSRSGPGGVQLRINGQPQSQRDRPDSLHIADELTVGARYWSNDAGIPPFNRGFLHGDVSQILLYSTVLNENELKNVEAWVGK